MNAVELKGLCKKYKAKRGETRTFELKDVSLTLPYGCIMGLIGENGAGKSTTIRLMLDILEKDEGEISLLGCKTAEERVKAKDEIGVNFCWIYCAGYHNTIHSNSQIFNIGSN